MLKYWTAKIRGQSCDGELFVTQFHAFLLLSRDVTMEFWNSAQRKFVPAPAPQQEKKKIILTGQILTADFMSRNVSYSFIKFWQQSINFSRNLFFCSAIDCFFTWIIPDYTRKWRRRIVAHTASTWYVFAWVVVEGGKISSLTLVNKLF